ncbi:phenylalanine--tRNA ligase subunit alpha [Patescibacteria group bacterium]|nr:phenylalanine--tRNA ligase subunit alpha [Patescibacteria group bacterium]MBU1448903.1 phenylalanine--tRNA ligase subunit alpha [Patescibacteria group bacterium]MBU2612987.1 phenylalanine--tRNA ligase subunit alpha [Patescibacteria group bacterium]
MLDQLNALKLEIEEAVAATKTVGELDDIEIKYLGRKGRLTSILKGLAEIDEATRPKVGAAANRIKQEAERIIAKGRVALQERSLSDLGEREREDVTEPGLRPPEGHLHLVTQAIREITAIFDRIGFTRTRYPEVDWDRYAFESLNMPADHPARDEWETFFMDAPTSKTNGRMVLTPHTSNAQVRELERGEFPVRMINIAKCYRRQSDATHVPMFHQFEGLYVDRGVSITHLRGVLDYFATSFFGPGRKTRLRPFHFRFTEPSFEIDVSCGVCGGTGLGADKQKCRVCKRGWLELGGAGMVHPNVLKAGNVDSKKYSGFAFGWGVERTYMMKEGMQIDDIRILYKNDVRFLKQF